MVSEPSDENLSTCDQAPRNQSASCQAHYQDAQRRQRLTLIQSLQLPERQYVVVGGAALSIRGVRDTDDIDLVVTPELFELLSRSGWSDKLRPNGKPGLRWECFEAYLDVNTETFDRSTSWLIENAEAIHGIPCVDLDTLVGWKRAYGRAKDLQDVEILEALCSGHEGSEAAAQHT